MKILIIGGTGNISTPITKMIQGKGHDITLFNYDANRPDWLLPEVKVICGNRTNLPNYEKEIFAGGNYDCVIDMICFEPKDAENDVKLFSGKTRQFIFCSTIDVYNKEVTRFPLHEDDERKARPSFPYGFKKVQCENIFLEAQAKNAFNLTIIRPSFTYNESWSPGIHSFGGQSYHLDRIKKGKPIIMHGDGTSIWVATYRDDTARAFVNAIGNESTFGQSYHLCPDEWMTHNHIWKTIARVMGAPEPDFVYIPTDFLFKIAPKAAEWCHENFRYNTILDSSKAKRDLDFKYTVTFEQGVKLCLDYMTKNNLIENSDNYPFYDEIVSKWKKSQQELAEYFENKNY
ncbi:MAG: NAD-dependent epimerase/dehydratase family protein [Bacteroidales bacterium]